MSMSNGKRLERLEIQRPHNGPSEEAMKKLRERLSERLRGIAARLHVIGVPPKSERSLAEQLALAETPEELSAASEALDDRFRELGLR